MSETGLSKAERTKRFIIKKSAPIFNKKGYAGTSLSDLTQATGLTKGSIYGNFKNKDEVAVCAFQHNLAYMIESLTAEMQAAARRLVICGMHVHIGIEDDDLRVELMNQFTHFLPLLLGQVGQLQGGPDQQPSWARS